MSYITQREQRYGGVILYNICKSTRDQKRCEGRLKRFDSCVDARAWNVNENIRSAFLMDYVNSFSENTSDELTEGDPIGLEVGTTSERNEQLETSEQKLEYVVAENRCLRKKLAKCEENLNSCQARLSAFYNNMYTTVPTELSHIEGKLQKHNLSFKEQIEIYKNQVNLLNSYRKSKHLLKEQIDSLKCQINENAGNEKKDTSNTLLLNLLTEEESVDINQLQQMITELKTTISNLQPIRKERDCLRNDIKMLNARIANIDRNYMKQVNSIRQEQDYLQLNLHGEDGAEGQLTKLLVKLQYTDQLNKERNLLIDEVNYLKTENETLFTERRLLQKSVASIARERDLLLEEIQRVQLESTQGNPKRSDSSNMLRELMKQVETRIHSERKLKQELVKRGSTTMMQKHLIKRLTDLISKMIFEKEHLEQSLEDLIIEYNEVVSEKKLVKVETGRNELTVVQQHDTMPLMMTEEHKMQMERNVENISQKTEQNEKNIIQNDISVVKKINKIKDKNEYDNNSTLEVCYLLEMLVHNIRQKHEENKMLQKVRDGKFSSSIEIPKPNYALSEYDFGKSIKCSRLKKLFDKLKDLESINRNLRKSLSGISEDKCKPLEKSKSVDKRSTGLSKQSVQRIPIDEGSNKSKLTTIVEQEDCEELNLHFEKTTRSINEEIAATLNQTWMVQNSDPSKIVEHCKYIILYPVYGIELDKTKEAKIDKTPSDKETAVKSVEMQTVAQVNQPEENKCNSTEMHANIDTVLPKENRKSSLKVITINKEETEQNDELNNEISNAALQIVRKKVTFIGVDKSETNTTFTDKETAVSTFSNFNVPITVASTNQILFVEQAMLPVAEEPSVTTGEVDEHILRVNKDIKVVLDTAQQSREDAHSAELETELETCVAETPSVRHEERNVATHELEIIGDDSLTINQEESQIFELMPNRSIFLQVDKDTQVDLDIEEENITKVPKYAHPEINGTTQRNKEKVEQSEIYELVSNRSLLVQVDEENQIDLDMDEEVVKVHEMEGTAQIDEKKMEPKSAGVELEDLYSHPKSVKADDQKSSSKPLDSSSSTVEFADTESSVLSSSSAKYTEMSILDGGMEQNNSVQMNCAVDVLLNSAISARAEFKQIFSSASVTLSKSAIVNCLHNGNAVVENMCPEKLTLAVASDLAVIIQSPIEMCKALVTAASPEPFYPTKAVAAEIATKVNKCSHHNAQAVRTKINRDEPSVRGVDAATETDEDCFNELVTMRSRCEEFEKCNNLKDFHLEHLNKTINILKSQLDTERAECVATLENRLKKADEEISYLTNKNKKLQHELDGIQEELYQLQRQLRMYQESSITFHSLKADMENQIKELEKRSLDQIGPRAHIAVMEFVKKDRKEMPNIGQPIDFKMKAKELEKDVLDTKENGKDFCNVETQIEEIQQAILEKMQREYLEAQVPEINMLNKKEDTKNGSICNFEEQLTKTKDDRLPSIRNYKPSSNGSEVSSDERFDGIVLKLYICGMGVLDLDELKVLHTKTCEAAALLKGFKYPAIHSTQQSYCKTRFRSSSTKPLSRKSKPIKARRSQSLKSECRPYNRKSAVPSYRHILKQQDTVGRNLITFEYEIKAEKCTTRIKEELTRNENHKQRVKLREQVCPLSAPQSTESYVTEDTNRSNCDKKPPRASSSVNKKTRVRKTGTEVYKCSKRLTELQRSPCGRNGTNAGANNVMPYPVFRHSDISEYPAAMTEESWKTSNFINNIKHRYVGTTTAQSTNFVTKPMNM